MGAESIEAEARGYNFLHLLAFSHRNDAEQVAYLNNPPEDAPLFLRKNAKNSRARGQSFLKADMRTRKTEKLTQVFSFSAQEFRQIQRTRSGGPREQK